MELRIQDLMIFYCCSERTARQRKKEILESFGIKSKNRPVLAIHLAYYERLSLSDVKTIIFE